MKLISWNIRGLGKLETKKVSISENEVRALWGKRNMDFMVVGSDGSTGGLLCIWDPDVFRMVDCCCNRRFILISGILRSLRDVPPAHYTFN